MSTTTASASSSAPAPTQAQAAAGARKTAGQTGGDLFSNLLALVGDTRQGNALIADPLATDGAPQEPGDALAEDTGNDPLSDLLSWVYPPGRSDLSAQGGAQGGALSGALSGALGGDRAGSTATDASRSGASARPTGPGLGQPAGGGVDISGLGLTAVTPGEQTITQAEVLLARGLMVAAPQTPPAGAAAVAFGAGSAQAGSRTAAPAGQAAGDKGRKPSLSVTATLQAREATGNDTARLQQPATAPTIRSTVALDSRLVASSWRAPESDAQAPALMAAGTSDPRRLMGERPAPGESLTSLRPEASIGTGQPAENAERIKAEDLAEQLPGAPEAEAETPGHLGAHQLRHASLRVGDGGADSIDVQLSINGQEVRVDFRTDSAETRQGLQQSAAPALGDLLERSGMQLGGVSVGGQGLASGSDQGSGGQSDRQTPGRGQRTSEPAEPVQATTNRPRADGSWPLDVFA